MIRRDGSWWYRGSTIGRKELVCLFSSVLKRDGRGQFLLETPAERGVIEVEDAPFVAVELGWAGVGRDQVLTFRTNVDQVVTAGPKHPIRMAYDVVSCEPTPYVHVRDGAGRFALEARIETPLLDGAVAVVPFIDAGSVSRSSTPDFADLRVGAGIGIRYKTTFGPIRVDVAAPLNPTAFDSPVVVYVSLGQAF